MKMDAFTNKLADEHAYDDESVNDKSFSSRHSNGGNEDDFNRVSLPGHETRKSAANDQVKADDIDFRMVNEVKFKHDLELSNNMEDRKDISNSGTDDQLDHPRHRRAGFGDEEDSDDDEDIDGKLKAKGTQGTIIGVFFP